MRMSVATHHQNIRFFLAPGKSPLGAIDFDRKVVFATMADLAGGGLPFQRLYLRELPLRTRAKRFSRSAQPTLQLAAQGEMAAEGAAAVVHEREGHCAILAIAALLP